MSSFSITVLAIIIVGIIMAIVNYRNNNKRYQAMKGLGISDSDFFYSGKYISGHPDINNSIEDVNLAKIKESIHIVYFPNSKSPIGAGKIPKEQIKNIVIEDASTVSKRVTATRLIALGVFAFAAQKKEKTEISYLIIEWNDGRFDHETMFEFYGVGSNQKSNEARNKLIKMIR